MDIYEFLYKVFDFYNKELFGGLLPYVVITLEEREGVRGYFSPSSFKDGREKLIGKFCINPKFFVPGNEWRVFSTIVHEMCHLYMKKSGENVVKGYHSKAWSALMESIGLLPTSNGKEDGKKTGFSMTHLVIKGGLFEKKTRELVEKEGMKFILFSSELKKGEEERVSEKSVPGRRVRYSCDCSSFWGRKGMNVHCNECNKDFVGEK